MPVEFGFKVESGGNVVCVTADGRLLATVPALSEDYQGTEDAVDIAQLIADALGCFTQTAEGRRRWDEVSRDM